VQCSLNHLKQCLHVQCSLHNNPQPVRTAACKSVLLPLFQPHRHTPLTRYNERPENSLFSRGGVRHFTCLGGGPTPHWWRHITRPGPPHCTPPAMPYGSFWARSFGHLCGYHHQPVEPPMRCHGVTKPLIIVSHDEATMDPLFVYGQPGLYRPHKGQRNLAIQKVGADLFTRVLSGAFPLAQRIPRRSRTPHTITCHNVDVYKKAKGMHLSSECRGKVS
jgi:hypothetical protein